MANQELIAFIRANPWGVVSSLGEEGQPQAALVGIAVSDQGEIVFDTFPHARKVANIRRDERVTLVVVVHDEVTMQIEGSADLPADDNHERLLNVYVSVFPDGKERADDGAVLVRIEPIWARISDFRPESSGAHVLEL